MKVDKIEIKATIPVAQYANLQPGITLTEVDVIEGLEFGMKHINNLFETYGEKGALVKRDISTVVSKKSFNEECNVNFEPILHVYVDEQGKRLTSATEYIKRFYKPFDSVNISAASAKAWGVEQKDVQDLWDSNASLTSSLGTVVHNALEHYHKFQSMGKVVQDKKELPENYAMPKHPILKSMIEGYLNINPLLEGEEIVAEALITDIKSGFCGHADIVLVKDWDNKICRIQDYKININAEEIKTTDKALAPWNELPANKLTKYRLQMSFYANMLQASGWTVEGLDVFVYENEWIHHKMEVLQVIPVGTK